MRQRTGSRVERKKEETRRRILETAMELFKEQGVEETTMEQIALAVDIAKGTLYNYFPVKEAIIDEFIKRTFRDRNPARVAQLQKLPDTRSRLIYLFKELMEGVRADKDIFEKYLVYRMQLMLNLTGEGNEGSGIDRVAGEIIDLGQKSGEIRDDFPPYVLIELFEFGFIEAVKRFFIDPDHFQTGEVIAHYVDLCLDGAKLPQKGRDSRRVRAKKASVPGKGETAGKTLV